jgi:pimeloyl-ACP methyl ester carboxylesterase
MHNTLIVIVVIVLIAICLISISTEKKTCVYARSTSNSSFVKSSVDIVPLSDIKNEQYLQDFFSRLRSRLLTEKKKAFGSSSTCERKTCRPLLRLTDVNFTEVPVVGAYGVNILVQRYSSGTGGKDILFLHGVSSSFLEMRSVFMNPWLLSHHNVHTMQNRGAGAGPYPDPFGPQGGYDLTVTWADDVNAAITALGFTPGNVVLVCHSFGTIVAADYIRKYGQSMLAGLFISNPLVEPLNSPYGFSSFDPNFLPLAVDLLTNGWVPDSYGWKTFIDGVNKFNDQHKWHECDMYPNQGIEWGAAPASWRDNLTHQLTLAHEPTPNLSTNGPPNSNLSDRLTTGVWPFITVPTHILSGLEDKVIQPYSAVDLHNAIPGSKITKIECAGHHTYVDNPTKYNCTLKKFLRHL